MSQTVVLTSLVESKHTNLWHENGNSSPGHYQQQLQCHSFIAAMCHSLAAHLQVPYYHMHDKRNTYIASKDLWPDYNKKTKSQNSCTRLDADTNCSPRTSCDVNTHQVTKCHISRYRNDVADDSSNQTLEGNTILRHVLCSLTTQRRSYAAASVITGKWKVRPITGHEGPEGELR
jgi:hypothetical protein